MRLDAIVCAAGILAAACGATTPRNPPSARALGMNDVTLLLPLPSALDAPVLATAAGDDLGAPLVGRDELTALVLANQDLAPKSGAAFGYDDFQLVAVRFDLCDRKNGAACRDGDDGQLRTVLQPLYRAGDAIAAHDIAVHAFYPLPAAELAGIAAELRAIAALRGIPLDAPLAVAAALDGEPRSRIRSLVLGYARADRLARLTVIGQDARSVAFAWRFRGVERDAAGALAPIAIPDLAANEQHMRVGGGNTIYIADPIADTPRGLALALNGVEFAAAQTADQRVAVEALAAIDNPALADTENTQCISCHVATFLTPRRAATAGVDPAMLESHFTSPYNTTVDSIAGTDPRSVRALGWATTYPAISQRVANETARVLGEFESRFPE